jgi:hypothetical protein
VIPDLLVAAALVLLVVLVVALLVVLVRDRARTRAELATTRDDTAELRTRIDRLTVQLAAARREPQEFVITHLGEDDADLDPAPSTVETHLDGKLFADLVLRETVVKAAAFGHGVRRAVAPEVRNRIRFEVRREVRRSRKARKDEFRQVRREMRDRQRAAEATA